MIEVAKEAAIKAGRIILSSWNKKHTYLGKKDIGDFSTEVDKLAEDVILDILKSKYSKHNFLSEETGKIDNESDYCWVIDPLDGTLAYNSGMPNFGVSIGLLYKQEPVLGVINLPAFKELLWAEKGKGAFLNGKRIKVSREKDLENAIVGLEFAHRGGRVKELNNFAVPIVDEVRYSPILACCILSLSYVARGIYGAYIHHGYPWDFVGGVAIIKEAGGQVTDTKSKEINWYQDMISVVVSNGKIHNTIIKLINK